MPREKEYKFVKAIVNIEKDGAGDGIQTRDTLLERQELLLRQVS